MKARVKAESSVAVVRSAGIFFKQNEWREVPQHAQAEIKSNPFLEVMEESEEPITPQTEATKMVLPRKRARKV